MRPNVVTQEDPAADYLALGPLLAERILQRVPQIKRVGELANLYEALDSADGLGALTSGQMPAVFVGYDGDVPGDTAGDGKAGVEQQRWLVVLAVASVRNADRGAGVQRTAGPLLAQLRQAIYGWNPQGFFQMSRLVSPRPGYRDGVGFFPLMFSTAIAIEGLDDED